MGSKGVATIAILLSLNLIIFFTTHSSAQLAPPTANCPMGDLRVCAGLLGVNVGVQIGRSQTTHCCSVINGLADADLEVAACVCTAIRANILGININVDLDTPMRTLLNTCGRNVPNGFVCRH